MFDLDPAGHDPAFLEELGAEGGPMDEAEADEPVGDSDLPAGNAFLGQYIDHTITLEVHSELPEQAASEENQSDPTDLQNFRTPRLDLDSVYGSGPEVDNYLYHQGGPEAPPHQTAKLRVGVDEQGNEIDDLQRNRDGIAIIGDPRNDENTIISQMQLAFIRFHNRVVDALVEAGEGGTDLFERAQELVRRHFQWVVVNQFLPRICDTSILDDVLQDGRQYFTPEAPEEVYLPIEFAGAAYRYGHSQIREEYVVNDQTPRQRFYGSPGEALGVGFQPISPEDTVQWKYFFDIDEDTDPQQSRKIDPLVPNVLLKLPFIDGEFKSLATRNLLRGYVLGLPSGQDIAGQIEDVDRPLTNAELGLEEDIDEIYDDSGSQPDIEDAPLWYYVLGEANHENDGNYLGPVGSRIVAETLVGLIEADPTSYRNQADWRPTLVAPETDTPLGEFRIQDILADGPLLLESELDRSIAIEGTGGGTGTWYTVEVSEEVEQATGTVGGVPVTDNPDETATVSRADGRVGEGADGYRFRGDITGLSLTDPREATVYVDGEEVNPGEVTDRHPVPRTLVIEGSGTWTEYSFRVSGELEQIEGRLEGIGVSKDEADTLNGPEATGAVVGGADGFRFSGEIIELSVERPEAVTVYVDGVAREVEAIPSIDLPRTLVVASDPSLPNSGYTVTVSDTIKQVEGTVDERPVSKNPNETVEDGTVNGYVAAGADGFRFEGEITEFSLDDPDAATVYVDRKVRNVDSLPSMVAASFDANPPDPAANEAVTFDGGASKDPDGSIARYEWEIRRGALGEGPVVESGTGERLSTRLHEPGTYTVRLFVTAEDGTTASTAERLNVETEPGAPTARIDGPSDPVQIGDRVTFSAVSSTDPDGEIVDHFWTVSRDGQSIAARTGESFGFTFEEQGDYTVRLQINDDDGRQDTTSVIVTVGG
jgi:hypothetical protein